MLRGRAAALWPGFVPARPVADNSMRFQWGEDEKTAPEGAVSLFR